MGDHLTDARLSAKRAYIAAETEYSEAYDAHRAAHSAAVAELASVRLPRGADILAWLRERKGDARERLDAAEQGLAAVRVEQLAIEDAIHADAQAAKAKQDAVRYADRVKDVQYTAEAAFLLASKAWMRLNPDVKEVRLR